MDKKKIVPAMLMVLGLVEIILAVGDIIMPTGHAVALGALGIFFIIFSIKRLIDAGKKK